MPSRWELHLPAINPAATKLEYLHALISKWLDTSDAEHHAQHKPYTITPPIETPSGTTIQIGLLNDQLVPRLLQATTPGTQIRLGSQHTQLISSPTPISATTWHQLANPTAHNTWHIEYLTPTTFRRRNNFSPFPAPKPVLGGLRATWKAFAPTELNPLYLDLTQDPMWVTSIHGTSHTITINELTITGFTGHIHYTCDAPPGVASTINTLMHLATYGGIGAYTTKGLGHIQLQATTRKTPRHATPGTAETPHL